MLPHETHDPHAMFEHWLKIATESEPNNPTAMCLATIDATERPSARMVLLKYHDNRGFVFFTNRLSAKGRALAAHPHAALCLYWKTLQWQVRIAGPVEQVEDTLSDSYFQTRSRDSCIGAWASEQSRPLKNRRALLDRVAQVAERFASFETIPRPEDWVGYRVAAETIEFWAEEPNRLHNRLLFTKTADGWDKTLLNP